MRLAEKKFIGQTNCRASIFVSEAGFASGVPAKLAQKERQRVLLTADGLSVNVSNDFTYIDGLQTEDGR